MSTPKPMHNGAAIKELYAQLAVAREQKRIAGANCNILRSRILALTGSDAKDAEPGVKNIMVDGAPLFCVAIETRKRLDVGKVKTLYPNIYAECETLSIIKTIRDPE